MNRAQRRARGLRRSAGHAARVAGAGVLIGAGLTGGYLGTFRSSRAQATIIGTSCAGLEGSGAITDDTTLRSAIGNINAGSCNIIDFSSNITVLSDLPPINAHASPFPALGLIALTDDSIIDGNGNTGFHIYNSVALGTSFTVDVTDVTLTGFGPSGASDIGAVAVVLDDTVHVQVYDSVFTDNTSLNGTGALLAVSVNAEATGDIRNSTFINNESTNGSGGAVYVTDDIDVFYSTFEANSADSGGGAIHSGRGDVTIVGGRFWRNAVDNGDGGAVRSAGGNISTGGAYFGQNSASGNGGAIAAVGEVYTTDDRFVANSSAGDGGAIWATGDVNTRGYFNGNGAASGGAIFSASGNVGVATGGEFEINFAVSGTGGAIHADLDVVTMAAGFVANTADDSGGAIFSVAGDVDINLSGFSDNESSSGAGGAIWAQGETVLSGTTFIRNIAAAEGGAVWSGGPVQSGVTDFDSNHAAGAGGAIYAGVQDVYVSDGEIYSNYSSGGHAGAIMGGRIQVQDSFFRANQAQDGRGGSLYGNANVYIYDTRFYDDSASLDGGAIWVDSDIRTERTYFGGSSADGGDGGAIRSSGTFTSIDDTFANAYAQGNGGAVYADDSVSILRSAFYDNYALTGSGAAVYAHGGYRGGYARVEDAYFRQNESGADGGAIGAVDLYVVDSTFVENTSGGTGGAAYASIDCEVIGSTFDDNDATAGGALGCDGAATIESSDFIDNTASGGNGGGAVVAGGAIYVDQTDFTRNVAAVEGGAVFTDDTVSVSGGTFTGNQALTVGPNGGGGALRGGAIYVDDSAVFTGNYAKSRGGVLYADSTVYVQNSTFTGNRAGDQGGVAHVDEDVFVLRSYLRNNVAGNEGGALWSSGLAAFAYSSFVDNYTDPGGLGGAIRSRTLLGYHSSIAGNGDDSTSTIRTIAGGAMFVDDSVMLVNSTLYDNVATLFGGAIVAAHTPAEQITFRFVTATDNAATVGDVLATSGYSTVTLVGTAITSNSYLSCYSTMGPPIDANPTSSYTYVSDTSCGNGGGFPTGVTVAPAGDFGFTTPISADDTPGHQVLIPDDTSILINKVPMGLRTRDQLGPVASLPYGYTTIGAVQVVPTPYIVAQPTNETVNVDDTVAFALIAAGGSGTLNCQWQSSSDSGATWSAFSAPSACINWLIIPSVPASDNGLQFRAIIEDANGITVTSNPATLTVVSPTPPAPPAPGPTPTPTPSPVPPSAPIIERVVAGDDTAIVEFVPTLDDSVLRYEYTLDDSTWIAGDPPITQSPFTVRDLDQGTTYRVRVRGVNEAGPGAASDPMEFTTTKVPSATIVITGAREGRRIVVSGNTTGLIGQPVTPRIKLRGQRSYASGRVEPVVDTEGRFTWSRKTGKKAYVYFDADGVRSNRVVISARTGSKPSGVSRRAVG